MFEHHRWRSGAQAVANNHLHVMDDTRRIALVRVGSVHPDEPGPPVQYHLSDHLESSNVVVDSEGGMINREEFTPYGETSFGSFSKKRYRFTGQERDEESGLSYHHARYYAPWIGRWSNSDPIGIRGGVNLHKYARENPTNFRDPNGTNPNKGSDKAQHQPCTPKKYPPKVTGAIRLDFVKSDGNNRFDPLPHATPSTKVQGQKDVTSCLSSVLSDCP